jgi:hypothetical protein
VNLTRLNRFKGACSLVLLCPMFLLLGVPLTGTAAADPSEYGIASVSSSLSSPQAGAHADFTARVDLERDPATDVTFAGTRDFAIDLPPGLIGDVQSYPACSISRFLASREFSDQAPCPFASQVGVVTVNLNLQPGENVDFTEPLYNLQPPEGSPARLGFISVEFPVIVDMGVRSEGDYGVTATARGLPDFLAINAVETVIWGVPSSPSHDGLRMTPEEAFNCGYPCESENGSTRPSGLGPTPFLTNPTSCGAEHVGFALTSYALPGRVFTDETSLPDITGCQRLAFDPEASISLTGEATESPSGLDFHLRVPREGLEDPETLAPPNPRAIEIDLPEGVTLNPAAANGLLSCSEAEVGVVSTSPIRFDAAPAACPGASRIGSAKIDTPLLTEPIEGSVFLARQEDNPFRSTVAVYLAARGQGLTVKLAGRLDLDPDSGRITATFDDLPRLPFSEISLHLQGGDLGLFVTPSSCGTYVGESALLPWSGEGSQAVKRTSRLPVSAGPGDRCSPDRFEPTFAAGTANPVARRFSPLSLSIARADGDAPLESFEAILPKGLVARLKGVPYCSTARLAALSGEGASCPAKSRVGKASVGVGAGPIPYFLNSGKAFLAGPYKGAPLSLAAVVPVRVGPFDLGTVVLRSAVDVDPVTARISIRSDPLPQILDGIPLRYRALRIEIDRRRFVLNPSSCDPMKIGAKIDSLDGRSRRSTSRFQVGSCEHLGFRPRLSVGLRGASGRSGHPSLRLILEMRSHDANLARAAVTLPRTALFDLTRVRTVCSRAKFMAMACPAGSVVGRAEAWSPILARPLRGPVYLRAGDHRLPDLVVALAGQIRIDLEARIDAVSSRIRTTFTAVPDLPFSKFALDLKGGRRGLVANTGALCAGPRRAGAVFLAHDGNLRRVRPIVGTDCRDGGGQ